MRIEPEQKGKRILIASHQPEEISLLETRLTARGYEVDTAEASVEVVHKVNRHHFDLILLDAKMEEVRHTELSALLRKRSVLRSIPIVMLADSEDIASLISAANKGFDDFCIRPLDPLSLQLRVSLNIKRAEDRLETNPLTQLPGNVAIEKTMIHLIEHRALFSVLYMDLDNFKALNDALGYKVGDDVLKQTAFILESNSKQFEGRIETFVGHVGGDDFIVIACPTITGALANHIIQDFDRVMLSYYTEEMRKRGSVTVKNRKGEVQEFPLVSLSVAETSNEYIPIQSPSEVAHRLTEVKKFLKNQDGSHYLKDRRGKPFTSIDEAAEAFAPQAVEKTEPLGQLLLKAGLIKEEQLALALEAHFQTGQHLGQILTSKGFVAPKKVGKMLQKKLGIPYAELTPFKPEKEILELFSDVFITSRQIVPLRITGGKIIDLGLVDPFDVKAIQEVEEITRLKVKPYLILEDEYEEYVAQFYGSTAKQS